MTPVAPRHEAAVAAITKNGLMLQSRSSILFRSIIVTHQFSKKELRRHIRGFSGPIARMIHPIDRLGIAASYRTKTRTVVFKKNKNRRFWEVSTVPTPQGR
jgi:hypothetical protein